MWGDPIAWVAVVVVLLALGGLVQLFVGISTSSGAASPEAFGVRLGMTPDEVRAAFAAPSEGGAWRSFDEGEVRVLRWESADAARTVRFELHAGALVAVRADLPAGDPLAAGPPLDVAPGWVLERRPPEAPGAGATHLTILARDCPAHLEEVERLLAAR